jgi:hypothetical protein
MLFALGATHMAILPERIVTGYYKKLCGKLDIRANVIPMRRGEESRVHGYENGRCFAGLCEPLGALRRSTGRANK